MILQILADARQRVDDRHADSLSVSGRPTPESSSRCGVPIAPAVSTVSRRARASTMRRRCKYSSADDAAVLDDQPLRMRAGDERQVGPLQHRLQKRLGAPRRAGRRASG